MCGTKFTLEFVIPKLGVADRLVLSSVDRRIRALVEQDACEREHTRLRPFAPNIVY